MTLDTKIWPDFGGVLGRKNWGLGGKSNLKAISLVRHFIELAPWSRISGVEAGRRVELTVPLTCKCREGRLHMGGVGCRGDAFFYQDGSNSGEMRPWNELFLFTLCHESLGREWINLGGKMAGWVRASLIFLSSSLCYLGLNFLICKVAIKLMARKVVGI